MKRPIIIVLFLITIIMVVAYMLLSPRSKPPLPTVAPQASPTPLPTAAIPQADVLKDKFIGYLLPSQAPKVKEVEAPVVHINKTSNPKLRAVEIALKFGKSGEPHMIGPRYSWSTPISTFAVGGAPSQIALQEPFPDSLPIIVQADVIFDKLARGFLTQLGVFPSGAKLVLESTRYLSPQNTSLNYVSKERATIIQLEYRLSLVDIPLFIGYPDLPIYSLRYNNSGDLFGFTGYDLQGLKLTEQTMKLISPKEASVSLALGRGSLLAAYAEGDINQKNTGYYNFSTITIRSINLGYYLGVDQSLVLPVYVFRGLALERGTNKSISTITIVQASN